MNDRVTVSILIPTFNEITHIDACLASVLAQNYPLLEVLVIDGGSTDGTRERVAEYGPPVRLVDNPGRGPASAMNVGIAASRGIRHLSYGCSYGVRSLLRLGEPPRAARRGC